MDRTIYVASDHTGFRLKAHLLRILKAEQYDAIDCGPTTHNEGDDYPLFAEKLCRLVIQEQARGILICDTGIGMSIIANRFPKIRAALVSTELMAERSRLHNDANVLCLGQTLVSEAENEAFVLTWLRTEFSGEVRHVRRLGEINEITETIIEEGA